MIGSPHDRTDCCIIVNTGTPLISRTNNSTRQCFFIGGGGRGGGGNFDDSLYLTPIWTVDYAFLISSRKYHWWWLLILFEGGFSTNCFLIITVVSRDIFSPRFEIAKKCRGAGNKRQLKIIKEQSTIPCIFSVVYTRPPLSLIFNEMHTGLVANKSTL